MADQLVGYDLVAGDSDEMEVVGADGKSRKVKADRIYALHMPITTLATLAGLSLQNSPSKAFRPDRVVVACDVDSPGKDLSLVRVGTIQAGNVTLTIGAQSLVHGTVYDPRAVGVRMKGETVVAGVPCSVAVVNASAGDLAISAAMFGLSNQ